MVQQDPEDQDSWAHSHALPQDTTGTFLLFLAISLQSWDLIYKTKKFMWGCLQCTLKYLDRKCYSSAKISLLFNWLCPLHSSKTKQAIFTWQGIFSICFHVYATRIRQRSRVKQSTPVVLTYAHLARLQFHIEF